LYGCVCLLEGRVAGKARSSRVWERNVTRTVKIRSVSGLCLGGISRPFAEEKKRRGGKGRLLDVRGGEQGRAASCSRARHRAVRSSRVRLSRADCHTRHCRPPSVLGSSWEEAPAALPSGGSQLRPGEAPARRCLRTGRNSSAIKRGIFWAEGACERRRAGREGGNFVPRCCFRAARAGTRRRTSRP